MAETARRAGVTPAAIAQRISALEQELGIKLVSRVGRNVKPTPAGSRIAEKCRGIVRDARALRSMELSGTPIGEMRIGAITTALTGLLPQPLQRLTAMAPQLEVFLLPGASPELYAQVIAGSLDAAVIVKPPFPLPKTCDWHVLRQEPMILLKSAYLEESDPDQLLRSQPYIRYDRNNWGGRLADGYLRDLEIQPADRFELDSLEAIAVMVSAGLGITIIPDWAPPWPEKLNVEKISLPRSPVREIGLVWARSTAKMKHIEYLLKAYGEISTGNSTTETEDAQRHR